MRVLAFPTPAPSPMKNPARSPLRKMRRCRCKANKTPSSCKGERAGRACCCCIKGKRFVANANESCKAGAGTLDNKLLSQAGEVCDEKAEEESFPYASVMWRGNADGWY